MSLIDRRLWHPLTWNYVPADLGVWLFAERNFDIDDLQIKLSKLTYREQEVLRLRYGIGYDHEYTLDEIGQKFCVTRERVRQIEAKALRKLRRGYGIDD